MMDLWLIELLCLGAEATVALLLIAFAWHPAVQPTDEDHAKEVDWEPAKRTYTHFWIHRGLYLQRWKSEQESKNKSALDEQDQPTRTPHLLANDDHAIYLHLIPEPWRDRLTSLVNRQGFDSILNAWSAIPPDHRSVSCVSLFSLNDYSTLVSDHGAMTIEQALRAVATHLHQTMSHTSIVARYQPDRFAVLHFSECLEDCHYLMEDIQTHIGSESFFRVNDEPLSMRCVVSIVDLLEDVDLVTQMDALEEGSLVAADNDSNVVSQVGGEWVEKPPEGNSDRPHHRPTPSKSDADLTNTRQSNGSSDSSAELDDNDMPQVDLDALVERFADEDALDGDDDLSTQDISAVASAADIEALFAQINSKKKSTENAAAPDPSTLESDSSQTQEKEFENPIANSNDDAPTKPTTSPDTMDTDGADTADDIAELFETVKSAISHPSSSEDNTNSNANSNPLHASDALPNSAPADDVA